MSIFKNILSGVGSFVNQATKFSNALNPLSTAVTAISGIFDSKDSGNQNPFGGGGSAIQTVPSAPLISTTTETGAGPFAGGGSSLQSFTGLNNLGSGSSLFPTPAFQNQDRAIETSQSSLGNFFGSPAQAGVLGIGSKLIQQLPKFTNFFGSQTPLRIPEIGEIIDINQDKLNFTPTRTPMFEEFTQLISPTTPMLQQQGAGFMSPILGRLKLSPRGTLIITRKMKSQFKSLADNVGLVQASNIAGVPLEIGAMIITKRFPQRSKSISTKKMRDCANTYKQVMNFAKMIPRRTATRTTRAKTMRGASTVIQNS